MSVQTKTAPRAMNSGATTTTEDKSMSLSQDIPEGFCGCGCGEKTPRVRYGEHAGTPNRFIHGHNRTLLSDADKVYSRIKVNPFGCWEFQGALNHGGYGIIQCRNPRKTDRSHRIVYREAVGEIPEGRDWTIDHLCMNARCCNPSHLELVTRAENARRQNAAGRGRVKRDQRY